MEIDFLHLFGSKRKKLFLLQSATTPCVLHTARKLVGKLTYTNGKFFLRVKDSFS